MSFAPGSIVKLKVESPNMVVADVVGEEVDCIWYDGHESLRDTFPAHCLVLVTGVERPIAVPEPKPDLQPAPAPGAPPAPKPPAGAAEPEPDAPEPAAVRVNTASGRITYRGKTCILAGHALTVVDMTAAAMPEPVDRAVIRAALWPTGGSSWSDQQLSGIIANANQRLDSIRLTLKSIRNRGVVLQEVEG